MDANQNPPSEHEWTIQEQEDFFASQDAVTGLLNSVTAHNGAWWTNRVSMPNFQQVCEKLFNPGIHVTAIVPPETGWPIAAHCPICKETTFVWNAYAIEPEKGDYWLMKDTCLSNERHRMTLALPKIEFRVHDPLPSMPFPSMMNWSQMMPIEEAKKRWPDTPIRGPHLLTAKNGEQEYCGGPGVCEWCIKGIDPKGDEK